MDNIIESKHAIYVKSLLLFLFNVGGSFIFDT